MYQSVSCGTLTPQAIKLRAARTALVSARFMAPGVVLAPMEGVHDRAMRSLLTELGGFRWVVTEFLRISQVPATTERLLAHVPEFASHAATPCGVPVDVQLLGSDCDNLAETAQRAAGLGARVIDLNFGCPAKTVNRHDGGAALLKDARRIEAVVAAVRRATPDDVAVSAKLRLGWSDARDIEQNALAAAQGGADWLTIHGRTREAGYRPPALWPPIGEVAAQLSIPVVANGDIFTVQDLERCRQETGLTHFMLGRGPLARPELGNDCALALLAEEGSPRAAPLRWSDLLARYRALAGCQQRRPDFLPGRFKQWGMLARRHAEVTWVDSVKRLMSADALLEAVHAWEQQTCRSMG